MKYYIIAGEASGDLHGANLIKELIIKDPHADIRFWGGDLMEEASGKKAQKHIADLAFMGFVEVIANLRTIMGNIDFCKKDILKFKPDALIFIDYPGFNMRIAAWAKKQGIPTHYYISPTVWAWKESRVKKIKRDFDHLYCILPFEKDFFESKHDYKVDYVGNPLLDAVLQRESVERTEFIKRWNLDQQKKLVALLPGSRKQEVSKILQVMLSVIPDYPDYEFVIAGAPNLPKSFYEPYLSDQVKFISDDTYSLLEHAYAGIITSGTATLETALFKVPQVVCYKANEISYRIAKALVNLKYISLVNLIMDREVVTELIQGDCNPKRVKAEFDAILSGPKREAILKDYDELADLLGGGGASKNVADLIVDSLPTN